MNIRIKPGQTMPAGRPLPFDNRYRLSDGTKCPQRPPPAVPAAPVSVSVSGSMRTCLGCNARHPFNEDGTPVGGALPCGH